MLISVSRREASRVSRNPRSTSMLAGNTREFPNNTRTCSGLGALSAAASPGGRFSTVQKNTATKPTLSHGLFRAPVNRFKTERELINIKSTRWSDRKVVLTKHPVICNRTTRLKWTGPMRDLPRCLCQFFWGQVSDPTSEAGQFVDGGLETLGP